MKDNKKTANKSGRDGNLSLEKIKLEDLMSHHVLSTPDIIANDRHTLHLHIHTVVYLTAHFHKYPCN